MAHWPRDYFLAQAGGAFSALTLTLQVHTKHTFKNAPSPLQVWALAMGQPLSSH